MKIYELAYTWYEDYSPRLFTSEKDLTDEEWKQACESLKHQAVANVIAKNVETWVGWGGIVEHICLLLEANGFQRIKPVAFSYFGSCIIQSRDVDGKRNLSDDDFDAICKHNDAVEKMV